MNVPTGLYFIILLRFVNSFRRLTKLENEILQKKCGISGLTQETLEDTVLKSFKVAYGNDAGAGDLPWAVKLYNLPKKKDGSQCTATIISPWHIITAAHCISGSPQHYFALGGTQ